VPQNSFTDFTVLRTGQTEALPFFIRDPNTDALIDVVGTSNFKLIDIADDSTKVNQNFPTAGSGAISRASTGVYQYNMNTSTYSEEYLATMRCVLTNEVIDRNIFVKSVPARQFAYAAALRVQVDKSRKSISDHIQNMDKPTGEPSLQFFYGYSDAHLIFYLERGVQIINAFPPYTGLTVDTFPFTQYGSLLIDAATIAALESQGIFAIDTDYNYSLGGNSLVIDHFTKLSSMIQALLNRFNMLVVKFKQQYRSKGLVLFQWLPGGVRAARTLNALPSGFWSRLLSAAYQ
jgi:hypothetical protein